MNKDEALKLALKVFENIKNDPFKFDLKDDIDNSITAIKEALAQPETLPWTNKMSIDVPNQPLYTAPHTWVGLTDAEVKKIVGSDRYTDLLLEVVNFVEAKLKEKNCG